VRATGPTARPTHSSTHLIDADLDAALPSLFFLGRGNPTDPLVSCQWGYIGPEALGSGVGFNGYPKVRRQFVDRAARYVLSGHASNCACLAQQVILSFFEYDARPELSKRLWAGKGSAIRSEGQRSAKEVRDRAHTRIVQAESSSEARRTIMEMIPGAVVTGVRRVK
jgi:hypothetical protein